MLRLGLIGAGIGASRAAELHHAAGRLAGVPVRYTPFDTAGDAPPWPAVFQRLGSEGYRGCNITHPYKVAAAALVQPSEPAVASLGSVNTVVFGNPPVGYNTDYSGFLSAWRERFDARLPGHVTIVGAGGVGRAIAFALRALGADQLTIVDRDPDLAGRLAAALGPGSVCAPRLIHADGVVNATPLGMAGHREGTIATRRALSGVRWVFDAVYTPPQTRFLEEAAAAGADILSGEALFLHQGLDAFAHFTGVRVDACRMRRALGLAPAPTEPGAAQALPIDPSTLRE